MIKINLLGDETVIDTTGTWIVIGYVLSVVATILALVLLYMFIAGSISDLTDDAAGLDKQLKGLQDVTKEVRDLDKKRKELADKTNVIATLKKNKLGPVRILDDLNVSLPEKSWLVEFKESGGVARISGFALDNQTIAKFMRELEASDYFDRIDLVESRLAPKNGVNIQEFAIQAKVNYGGFNKKNGGVSAVASPSLTPLPSVSPSIASTTAPSTTPASSLKAASSSLGEE